ncbi:MAG: glycosyltransferase family 9 protein [Candidatus Omnitrophota bacterium]|jgi:ADP-heptose:LPS heptosyltransferase
MRKMLLSVYLVLRKFLLNLFFPAQVCLERGKVNNILLVRLDRLGDLVHSLPAIKAVEKSFPQANISVLVNAYTADFLKGQLSRANVLILPAGFWQQLNFLSKIKAMRFDLVVDLSSDYPLRPAFLVYLTGASYRLGYEISGRGVFFNIRTLPVDGKITTRARVLDLVRKIGVEADDTGLQLNVTNQVASEVEKLLFERGIRGQDKLIIVAAGGYYPSQLWGVDNYASLILKLLKAYDVKVVLAAAKANAAASARILSLVRLDPLASGRILEIENLALDKLVALILRSSLFIGDNSGPLHIASALGVPTVSTMGPTEPEIWAPLGEKNIVLRKPLSCSPCNKPTCRKHECMRLIRVEDMLEAVEKQLKVK